MTDFFSLHVILVTCSNYNLVGEMSWSRVAGVGLSIGFSSWRPEGRLYEPGLCICALRCFLRRDGYQRTVR